MKINTTKRSLLTSVIALMLCFAMLLGTTFAWFTDSVTSANNIIKSGNLDVAMYWADGTTDPDTTTWTDASTGAIFNYDNWEPGYVEVRHIKIANEGSLALKYKVLIEANGEVTDLADVIDVYYTDPAAQVADRTQLIADKKLGTLKEVLANLGQTGNGTLESGAKDVITIAFKMQESAGNAYQGKAIGTDFSIVLLAAQLASEDDSFDDQYDKDGKYDAVTAKVTTADELATAIAEGNPVVLSKDIELNQPIELAPTSKAIINLGGFTLTNAQGTAIEVTSGEVEIKNGTIKNGVSKASRSTAGQNTSIVLSGDAVATITNVTIETEGTGISLSDNARITELNANIDSYLNEGGVRSYDAVYLGDNARIDLISGGTYTSYKSKTFIDTWYNDPKHTYSATESWPIALNGDSAYIGEISGGTFLGEMDKANNGTPIHVNAGRIEKISGGYFGFYKSGLVNPIRNVYINSANGGSIGAITGGTFEKGSLTTGFGCDFESLVDASGCKVVETGETVDVNTQFSTKVTTYTLKVLEVVAK